MNPPVIYLKENCVAPRYVRLRLADTHLNNDGPDEYDYVVTEVSPEIGGESIEHHGYMCGLESWKTYVPSTKAEFEQARKKAKAVRDNEDSECHEG